MKKLFLLFILAFGMSYWGWGQTPYQMSSGDYFENFNDIANWTNNFASGIGASCYGSVAVNASGTIPDGVKTTISTATFTSGSTGGGQRGSAQTTPTTSIVLLSIGATDNTGACAIDLLLNFSGRNAGTLSFDWASVNNSTGDRKASLRIYTSTDGTTFTELTAAQVLNFTNNSPTSGSIITVSLPTSFNNITTSRIRFYEYNGTGGTIGSRPKISIDNVAVTSTPASIPSITVNPAVLNGFTYIVGSGPSISQSYSLSGANLAPSSGNIIVTAPTDYEVSSDNTNFYGSLLIPYTGGTLASTTINVRLKAGLSANYYNNENVTNAGGGATTMIVTCSGMVLPGSAVFYSWTGADLGDWTVASNWNPSRTIAFPNDILQFNDNTVKTITNVPTQTICQINVSNNTAITFQAAAGVTLTLEGGIGTDLLVGAGSQLNLGGTSAITMTLPAGVTGNINGSITFSGGAHRLMGTDNGSLTFASGSIFTAGTGFLGNAFGTTALNSVFFQSGSTYLHSAGSNPFGASQPNSVVTFQSGSLYKLIANQTPSFSGRTYGNFELDYPSGIINVTGTSSVILDNLIITNGTLNFNMTGTPGHSIKGNIMVANGQTLAFNPASSGIINLNGTAVQTIGGTGTITSGTNSTIVINNSNGVVLNNNFNPSGSVTVNSTLICNGTSVISGSGTFTLASGATLKTGNTSGLDGSIAISGTKTFDPAANYEFNGTSAQVTGTQLPATINNLTIDNAAGVSLSNAFLTIGGNLTINSGKLFSVDSDKQVTVLGKALLK